MTILLENPEVQSGLTRLASLILTAYAQKSATVLTRRVADDGGADYISADSLPGLLLGDLFPNRRGLSKFPEDIRAFITDFKLMRIAYEEVYRNRPLRGLYLKRFTSPNEIRVFLSEEEFQPILDVLKARKEITGYAVYDVLRSRLSTLVHELRHAYDDWQSKGRAFTMTYKSDNHEAYLLSNEEISARYTQTVSTINLAAYKTFRDALEAFKSRFVGWQITPPDVRRRLVKRLGAEWTSRHRVVPTLNITDKVARLQAKVKEFVPGFWVRTRDDVIEIAEMGTEDPKQVAAILTLVCRMADIYRKTVGIQYMEQTPVTKGFGFVRNRGSRKRYALSWGTYLYREPVR